MRPRARTRTSQSQTEERGPFARCPDPESRSARRVSGPVILGEAGQLSEMKKASKDEEFAPLSI